MEEKYFTPDEIKNFKEGSLKFPLFIYEGTNENNVIEVTEVISLGGMAENNGILTEITMYKHKKGKEKTRLVYTLTDVK
jgi:hypothetical protein